MTVSENRAISQERVSDSDRFFWGGLAVFGAGLVLVAVDEAICGGHSVAESIIKVAEMIAVWGGAIGVTVAVATGED
jgi:hypothetical protein